MARVRVRICMHATNMGICAHLSMGRVYEWPRTEKLVILEASYSQHRPIREANKGSACKISRSSKIASLNNAKIRGILHTQDSGHIPLKALGLGPWPSAMGQKPWPNQIVENNFQIFDFEKWTCLLLICMFLCVHMLLYGFWPSYHGPLWNYCFSELLKIARPGEGSRGAAAPRGMPKYCLCQPEARNISEPALGGCPGVFWIPRKPQISLCFPNILKTIKNSRNKT